MKLPANDLIFHVIINMVIVMELDRVEIVGEMNQGGFQQIGCT